MSDGKIFEVSEILATMDVEKEDVIIARVAKAIDHYELVGADTQAIKLSELKDLKKKKLYLENIFPKIKMNTPKDALMFLALHE